ncbi:MAG: TetR/AcrR family transcriptional regulator [Burkholderiaceae bacterium]|jgi:AcrR family transcriptional regulator|nr:TetR/AcrR family transcriptional regulator [Burkholderiaceae bacterium]
MTSKKTPRRTAERILQTAFALFNRYGEPNVSTNMIAATLAISPGNLYYHYPAKETLVNTLFDQYDAALTRLLDACAGVRDLEDAWFCLHSLFELIWQYRFLYRDLNHLLSGNRHIETRLPDLLAHKKTALCGILEQLAATKKEADTSFATALPDAAWRDQAAASMVVVLTWWLSYEYVLDPRHAMEPGHEQTALLRGARHVLTQFAPHLPASGRAHLQAITAAYA